MNKSTTKLLWGLGATLVFGLASGAKADTISYNYSSTPVVQVQGQSNDQNFTIPTFDSRCGRLNSITFRINGQSQVRFLFNKASQGPGTATNRVLNQNFSILAPGAGALNLTQNYPDRVVNGPTANPPEIDVEPTESGNSTTVQAPPNAAFITNGPGSILLTLRLQNNSNVISPGFNADVETTSQADVTITYDFDRDLSGPCVPEPTSAAMLAAGLVGVGAASRRRFRLKKG